MLCWFIVLFELYLTSFDWIQIFLKNKLRAGFIPMDFYLFAVQTWTCMTENKSMPLFNCDGNNAHSTIQCFALHVTWGLQAQLFIPLSDIIFLHCITFHRIIIFFFLNPCVLLYWLKGFLMDMLCQQERCIPLKHLIYIWTFLPCIMQTLAAFVF